MDEADSTPDDPESKPPRIVPLGSYGRQSRTPDSPARGFRPVREFDGNEVSIEPISWPFEPNQEAEHTVHDDGILELTVLQEGSTPGIRLENPIRMPAGSFVLTVVGHAGVEGTFFPWAMNQERVRLTPTIHVSTAEEPISVPFRIEKATEVVFGVLSHRQEVGDKCYIRSMHITEARKATPDSSKGNFHSIQHSQLIPHQNTTLLATEEGTRVTSKPISTPGTFAIVEVPPSSILTLNVQVSIAYPSVAFLYVADADSSQELIKRNVVFESSDNSEYGEPSELFTSLDVPSGTSRVRIGILFSTASQPDEHMMTIHRIEVSKHHRLTDFVDEAYVMSLEDEDEKFQLCARQAERLGVELTRWSAVDGMAEGVHEHWLEYMGGPWTAYDKTLGRKAIEKPGAWGYLLSMRDIFEDALDKGHEAIAVFDNDFILSEAFDHRFSKLVEVIGEDWEVIYLGASQWLWDDVEIGPEPFYRPDANTNGTFAVLYKRSVFRAIIGEIDRMDAPFDAGPLRSIVLGEARETSYVAFPSIVIANLEKPGIRDSRNQIEFSKRFGWDLHDFPSWFTSWRPEPTLLRDDGGGEGPSEGLHFLTAVTTVNRMEYLKRFVADWIRTRIEDARCTLVVADDGSTDGTIEWLTGELDLKGSRLVVLRNDGRGIARQTNSILDFITTMDDSPDVAFICNDDISFLKPGWDRAYYDAMTMSGYEHLVYFNPEWKDPSHSEPSPRYEGLHSSCTAREAMGCFYTLTPALIDSLGYFDEVAFPVRGHSHIDYTLRACRAEANDSDCLFDIVTSNDHIGMMLRDGYKRTYRTLTVKERIETTTDAALGKREAVLLTEGRVYVPRGW